jgi:uncharacterized protein YkwD
MKRLALLAALLISAPLYATDITVESVIAQLNFERAAKKLPPLRHDDRLAVAAADRIRDMEDQGYWAHVGPDGNSPFRWLKPHGYNFWFAGENLASGFETAEVMVEGWMESKGHRDNILSPMYADCGIAILEGSTTRRATGYSVVVIFAREQPELKPAKQARK